MNNIKEYKEIYISLDVEAVGPIPGPYSMSSIGAFAAGAMTKDGEIVHFDAKDPENLFYAELKPISDKYVAQAINVGLLEGFDNTIPDPTGERHFNWMIEHGDDPELAMNNFADWVANRKEHYGAVPVFMGYPAGFDWMFVYWYLVNFNVDSPFGFSRMIDLKTAYAIKTNSPMGRSTKRYMPKSLFPKLPHTHRADDDALEQGVFGINLLQWNGQR